MAEESATAIALAEEARKRAEEELRKKKLQEEGLLAGYGANVTQTAEQGKQAAAGQYGTAREDVENLYSQGYKNLEDLYGAQSEGYMKESLRPIEGTLAKQGLLGGPSGALNEALAGAAERIRLQGIDKLGDYLSQKTSGLANLYGSQAQDLAGLESQYSAQQLSKLQDILGANLENTELGLDIATKYGLTGLEAALGTNKMVLQQQGAMDLAEQQAQLAQETAAAQDINKESDLAKRQDSWDLQFYSLKSQLYSMYRQQGLPDNIATQNATVEANRQMGPRPTV